jgi:hypothetical protein
MEKEKKIYLYNWAMHFFKHRDIIQKNIISIEEKKDKDYFEITYKTKKQITVPISKLSEIIDYQKIPHDSIAVITFNTKENYDFLISRWNDLVEEKKLIIYLINPISTTDKKWHIVPYTHNLIADSDSLVLGLQALFSSVESLNDTQIKKVIKEQLI